MTQSNAVSRYLLQRPVARSGHDDLDVFLFEQALDGDLRVFVVLDHQHFLDFRVQQPLDLREHAVDVLHARPAW